MPTCACPCGKPTRGGTFCPGHDTKLRVIIEGRVGGLLALDRFVDAASRFAEGAMSADEFKSLARSMFNNPDPAPRETVIPRRERATRSALQS